MQPAQIVPMPDNAEPLNAARHIGLPRPWRKPFRLSSLGSACAQVFEDGLAKAAFDRAPWLAVIMFAGIISWFMLETPVQWLGAVGGSLAVAIGAKIGWHGRDDRWHLRQACIAFGVVFAFAICLVWVRSEMVGAEAIDRPRVEHIEGHLLAIEHQPARQRSRLTLAARIGAEQTPRKIRVNTQLLVARADIVEGATISLTARLMPPAPPFLPGGFDFARRAWFDGLAATGSVQGEIEVTKPATRRYSLAGLQRGLAEHVRSKIGGSAGTIAAAFASGDRGAITESDADAMRDAGLTHLLAISGLHVGAVIAAAYLLALKLLALIPCLAVRLRLPVVASLAGAIAGIAYTLLTGAQVPTVRSCAAAMLVLVALAIGRNPLTFRMVAIAAGFVMLLWPETVIGPSFQMSFAAVLAIVALHGSQPAKAYAAVREEPLIKRGARSAVLLFLTGLVIELALMPVVLFHFHRAGVYGALANLVAIPLVTMIAMPAIALSLALDAVGLGSASWWLVELSLDLLLTIAHTTAEMPGAVKRLPQLQQPTMFLFAAGGLWLALWNGRIRAVGLIPIGVASLSLTAVPQPDVLVGRDGYHIAFLEAPETLISLRETRSNYVADNMLEHAGVGADMVPVDEWTRARCSAEFCTAILSRPDRDWRLLMARNRVRVEERALAAACARADIVIADRWLPRSCRPRWLKLDRAILDQTGGVSLFLDQRRVATVAQGQGQHGWWKPVASPAK